MKKADIGAVAREPNSKPAHPFLSDVTRHTLTHEDVDPYKLGSSNKAPFLDIPEKARSRQVRYVIQSICLRDPVFVVPLVLWIGSDWLVNQQTMLCLESIVYNSDHKRQGLTE